MKSIAIILVSERSRHLAETILKEYPDAEIHPLTHVGELFSKSDALVFIGAMGICIRTIAPYIRDKYTDPAIVNIDSTGQFVVSVLSGHVGGANELSTALARVLGAQEVITTQSDGLGLWALDTIGKKYGWKTETSEANLNAPITLFVNDKRVAFLLDIKDSGTAYMERTKPPHVDLFYNIADIEWKEYELFIAVTPKIYREVPVPAIYYRPSVLHLGMGCRRQCSSTGVAGYLEEALTGFGYSPLSIASLSSIELKKDEPMLHELATHFGVPLHIFSDRELDGVEVPNPSKKVEEVTSVPSVSEASSIMAAKGGALLLEKQKGALSAGNEFTFALAQDRASVRAGHIEIVGAGPGDPELVSVKGKRFLQQADLILYAGSLVPIELTHYAKAGATVRSSASMSLEEQFEIMKEFYDKGLLVVRLHTGDPCIYGAIQEQMALFDAHDMSYHITPGISSFQAAAAALRSQFTIPEKVQTIILTRGEGRTMMPEKEKLHLLARSQSTMCIFLSAGIVRDVQAQLLEHYPPTTPVAACYKLTWKDERIYRGELKDLAKIVEENNLTLTTMIVVGEAIDNRHGLSRLYADEFKHLFRT